MKKKRQVAARWNLHPGEILREDLRLPVPRIHDIVLEKRGITADTAVRLARFFGASPEFWMNAQRFYEGRLAGGSALSALCFLPKK
jgi:plasmid maintenance system antidote protein VapI